MNREEIKKQMLADNFMRNNGKVLCTINILRYQYSELQSVESVLKTEGVEHWEFMDCINYLSLEGYIRMRDIQTLEPVPELSQNVNYKQLEAKLSSKGIKLLMKKIKDDAVEV